MTERKKYTAELRFGYADTGNYYVAGAKVADTPDAAVQFLRDNVDYTRQEIFERFSALETLVDENSDDAEEMWCLIFDKIINLEYNDEAVWIYEGLPQEVSCDDYPEPEDPEREFVGLRIYEKVGN